MNNRDLTESLQDILAAISAIERFMTEVEFEDFIQNEEKIFAVFYGKQFSRDCQRRWRSPGECPIYNRKSEAMTTDYFLIREAIAS